MYRFILGGEFMITVIIVTVIYNVIHVQIYFRWRVPLTYSTCLLVHIDIILCRQPKAVSTVAWGHLNSTQITHFQKIAITYIEATHKCDIWC